MPTTFQNMRDLVVANTKRPELTTLTDNAIRMATLRAHGVDFFPRDRASFVATYTVPSGVQLFVDILNVFTTAPLLRTPDCLIGQDATTLLPVEILEYIEDYKGFWDNDNQLRTSVFTQMGENLRARFASPTGRVEVHYYKNPDTAVATYSSWIANLHPEELAMWAAGIVWARAGFLDQSRVVKDEHVTPFIDFLITSYLSSKV